MIRNISKIHNEFRLFGIKIFSTDYTVTEIEESNEKPRRNEQIMFLEKLYRQDNRRNNKGEDLS